MASVFIVLMIQMSSNNLGVMGKELADVGAGLAHLVKFENGSGLRENELLAGSHSRNALALANGIRQFGPP